MQIKREFEMTSSVSRRFIVHQSPNEHVTSFCEQCGEPMVLAEHAAKLFGVRQRQIFQNIESGDVHFCETDTGATLICIASMVRDGDPNALELGPGK